MQRECKFCDNHQQVNMEKPEGAEKWVVTNLDGSYHKHVKYGGNQPEQTTISDTSTVQEAKITSNLRSEAIAKAHEENMDSNEKLRTSINNLNVNLEEVGNQLYNITKQLSAFNDIVRAYLQSLNKE